MAENDRYYWLKLKNTYFNQLEQKKMRRQEHGKDMQIIYLRMMLLSIDKKGYIYYQGVYDSIEEELAEEFGEEVKLISETLEYLKDNNMIDLNDNFDCFLPEVIQCTGSECKSAERVRKSRNKKKLQCNNDVAESNGDVTASNTEIEKEIEKEIENRDKRESIDYQQIADMYNDTCVSFPRITKLSEARKKAIKARLNKYSMDDFKKLFEMAEGSSFLKGENGRNWSANFDWMMKDANFAKILDGNYQDKDCTSGKDKQEEKNPYENWELPSYYEGLKGRKPSPDDPFQ